MSGRALFLTIWTPLMALTVWGLFFKRPYLDQSGKPLAHIEGQVGDIQYRTEEEILWRSTEENQYVFENDNIATGDNSFASLNFGNSRVIELGPNTQIRIRPLSSSGNEFELDLLHGNIAARDRATGANGQLAGGSGSLKIHAGKQMYLMSDNAELGLQLGRADSEGSLAHADGAIQLTSGDGAATSVGAKLNKAAMALLDGIETELQIAPPPPVVEVQKKPRVLAAKPVSPMPVTAPPPQAPVTASVAAMPPAAMSDELKARSLMPSLLYPPEDSILWIAETFENAAKIVIPVALAPPPEVSDGNWQPVLGAFATLEKERPKLLWEGSAAVRRQVIPINLTQLAEKNILKTNTGEPPERQFIIAPGVKIKKDDKSVPFFGEPRTIVARSAAIKLEGPVKIELGRMDFKEIRQPWFVTPQDFQSSAAIFFRETIDLAKLASVLHVSRGFRWVAQDDPLEGRGIYILRNNKVVGKLTGAIGNRQALEAVRKGIDADVIFRGTAAAYIGGLTEFKERALKKLLPEKVYIVNNGRFIAVNRDFMTTNPALRRFLDENSPAFFAEPIETLAANNFLQ